MNFQRLLEDDPLLRREVRERWRRPLTYLLLLLFSGALCFLTYTTYQAIVPATLEAGAQSSGLGHQLFETISRLQALVAFPLGVFLAAPSLAAERERGALQEYFLAGLSPAQIVRAKLFALGSMLLVCLLLPLPCLSLCFVLGGVSPLEFAVMSAFSLSSGLLGLSLGLIVSAQTKTVSDALTWALLSTVLCLFVLGCCAGLLLDGSLFVTLVAAPITILFVVPAAFSTAVAELRIIERKLGELSEKRPPSAPVGTVQKDISGAVTMVLAPRAGRDFEPGTVNETLAKWASFSPVCTREVRGTLRRWEDDSVRLERREANGFWWGWLFVCLVGAFFVAEFQPQNATSVRTASRWLFLITTFFATHAAILGAHSFLRERALKTLPSLQLTPLSPLQIVFAKSAASFLLAAKWGLAPVLGALLALVIVAPQLGLPALFAVLSLLVFGAIWGVSLSFALRVESFASLGALVGVTTVFLAGQLFLGWPFRPPVWLKAGWLEPIAALYGNENTALPLWLALFRTTILALSFSGALFWATAISLARQRFEEGTGESHSFLTRDLTKGLR